MIFYLLEALAVVVIVLLTVFGFLDGAIEQSLARAAASTDGAIGQAQTIRAAATRSAWLYGIGIGIMLGCRLLAVRDTPRNINAHFAIPAAALLTGFGLALHWGYADHAGAQSRFLYAPSFAEGIFWGSLIAGLVMAAPWDPGTWADRGRAILGIGAVLALVALLLFGEAPGGTDVKIRLFGFQPIEGVKLAFVAFLAASLGRRASQLRYQRLGRGWFQVPRPKLLLQAVLLLLALFGGLVVVRDLGPTLILALVFLAFYFVVTRSWIEVLIAALVVPVMIIYLVKQPPAFLPENVIARLEMWLDPWLNGFPGGDQLAASLWSIAAGGFSGQGWGEAEIRHLPTGHTDLILAHLLEVKGFFGLMIYIAALMALTLTAFWVAVHNRTPERMLLAFGLGGLLFAQWIVIYAGTVGLLPLTGVVVPLLSYGKTSMVTFLVVVALIVRLSVNGHPRAERDELFQLRRGFFWVMVPVAVVVCGALVAGANLTIFQRSEISARGVLAMGSDETVFLRYNPRLRAIANRIRRGEILDRNGVVIAGTRTDRSRVYPLGTALGTLLGPVRPGITPPGWAVEGLLDSKLRGLAPPQGQLAVWIEKSTEARDRILFPVESGLYTESDHDLARQLQRPGTQLLFTPLRQLDFQPLLPIAQLNGEERKAAIEQLVNDLPARTVQLTIDARLQDAASRVLRGVVTPRNGRGELRHVQAGAVVVLDVDTGQVLARAQWPDYDPGNPSDWLPKLRSGDAKFQGSYGAWRDKTGIGGLYQSGSIFKLVTAMAWIRQGAGHEGASCDARGTAHFDCVERNEGRPSFSLPEWSRPIHDSHDFNDGDVELAEGLEVSCNVFFAQVGLQLGPEPFQSLVADGLEVDNKRTISPGDWGTRLLGSTAFGQGVARMHAMEAARMVATVSGGIYRKCPPTMLLNALCEERTLIAPPSALEPILSGMKRVIDRGTAKRFRRIEGVRVYAKTGSATDPGREDEVPYDLTRGEENYPEHSWLVALAESTSAASCEPTSPGRLAIAAVVPRGGEGGESALDVVQGVLEAANDLGYFNASDP